MPLIPETELPRLVEENKTIYDDYLDLEFTRSLIENVFYIVDETYFRSRFVGFRELPERNNPDRPLIYAGNHSGMAFPWDAMIFTMGLFKKHNYEPSKLLRPLTAPALSQTRLMNPFMIPNIWRMGGGVDANTLNFETMMEYTDSDLLIYPEGVPGIGKGFDKKYQLQRFSSSFVRMSLKHRTDIIPVITVNGEYINPYVYSVPWINRVINKIGIPYLPIGPLTLVLLLQPWLFYFSWPAKLIYVRGRRIKPYEMTSRKFSELTQQEIRDITEKVRVEMQHQLNLAVAEWGEDPFHFSEFLSRLGKNIRKVPYNLPFGWPLIFSEFERQYFKTRKRPVKMRLGVLSTIRIIFQNPFILAYFIPLLGWIPILIRGLSRVRNGD